MVLYYHELVVDGVDDWSHWLLVGLLPRLQQTPTTADDDDLRPLPLRDQQVMRIVHSAFPTLFFII